MDSKNLVAREKGASIQTRLINGIHVAVLPDHTTSVDSAHVNELVEDDLPTAEESDKA